MNYSLVQGTVIGEKYIIECYLSENDHEIVYEGKDINIDLKVLIYEFFPHKFVKRSADNNSDVLLQGNKLLTYYESEMENYLTYKRESAQWSEVIDFFYGNNTIYLIKSYKKGNDNSEEPKHQEDDTHKRNKIKKVSVLIGVAILILAGILCYGMNRRGLDGEIPLEETPEDDMISEASKLESGEAEAKETHDVIPENKDNHLQYDEEEEYYISFSLMEDESINKLELEQLKERTTNLFSDLDFRIYLNENGFDITIPIESYDKERLGWIVQNCLIGNPKMVMIFYDDFDITQEVDSSRRIIFFPENIKEIEVKKGKLSFFDKNYFANERYDFLNEEEYWYIELTFSESGTSQLDSLTNRVNSVVIFDEVYDTSYKREYGYWDAEKLKVYMVDYLWSANENANVAMAQAEKIRKPLTINVDCDCSMTGIKWLRKDELLYSDGKKVMNICDISGNTITLKYSAPNYYSDGKKFDFIQNACQKLDAFDTCYAFGEGRDENNQYIYIRVCADNLSETVVKQLTREEDNYLQIENDRVRFERAQVDKVKSEE